MAIGREETKEAGNDLAKIMTKKERYEADKAYSLNSDEDILGREETIAGPGEHPAQAMGRLTQALRTTRKLGGENSEKFQAVDQSLSDVFGYLQLGLNKEDVQESQSVLFKVLTTYERLITACEGYVNFRLHLTSSGRTRQKVVKEILHRARVDLSGLRSYLDSSFSMPETERASSVAEALSMARRRVLKLDNKTEGELKHVGGAASYIGVIEAGDLTDKSTSGFFKEEDIYHQLGKRELAFQALETVHKRIPISDQDYQEIRQKITEQSDKISVQNFFDGLKQNISKYWEEETVHEYVDAVIKVAKGMDVISSKVNGTDLEIYLKNGKSINMSRRNVAASRIANLFGVGDLIAQSETAILEDSSGEKQTGNLMQKARGKEGTKVAVDLQREKFRQAWKESNYKGTLKKNLEIIDEVYLTPEFLKSLTSLQVLDNLMGQADRHGNNFMIEQDEEGRMQRVQGIDNDFSFGYHKRVKTSVEGISIFNHGKKDRDISGTERTLTLPYMDAELANRILEVTPEEVRLVLADLIEEPAIEAFIARLEMVQKGIQQDQQENPDSGRYLHKTEDWANTLEFFQKDGDNASPETYVGRFLFNAKDMLMAQGTFTELMRGEGKREMVAEVIMEEIAKPEYANLSDEQHGEKVRKFLESFSTQVNRQVTAYLEKTGKLNRGMDIAGILSRYVPEIRNPIFEAILKQYQQ